MAGSLSEADLRRLARDGVEPLPVERALELFDQALASKQAVLLPMRVRPTEFAPPLVRELGRVSGVRRMARDSRVSTDKLELTLVQRLTTLSPAESRKLLLDTVLEHVARVLGHAHADAVDPDRGFGELGVGSLSALELRNRFSADTGLRLSATLTFDYPTPAAIANYLFDELVEPVAAAMPDVPGDISSEMTRLEALLDAVVVSEEERSRVAVRLRDLTAKWADGGMSSAELDSAPALESATADELFDILDDELESRS
jgi:acyl carrier protein